MTNKIENTAAVAAADPLLGLVMGMGIEAQEARGQAQFVESDVLPVDLRNAEALFERLGFVLGEPVAGDPLFRHATLPPGWRRVQTDHSMWTKIEDDLGRDRVSVFYKAAFYDRSAHAYIVARFRVDASEDRKQWRVVDGKTGMAWPSDDHETAWKQADAMSSGTDVVAAWDAP